MKFELATLTLKLELEICERDALIHEACADQSSADYCRLLADMYRLAIEKLQS